MNLIQISSFKKIFLATLLYHRFMLSLKYLNTFFLFKKKQDIFFFLEVIISTHSLFADWYFCALSRNTFKTLYLNYNDNDNEG